MIKTKNVVVIDTDDTKDAVEESSWVTNSGTKVHISGVRVRVRNCRPLEVFRVEEKPKPDSWHLTDFLDLGHAHRETDHGYDHDQGVRWLILVAAVDLV